jgi:hypothetical protein
VAKSRGMGGYVERDEWLSQDGLGDYAETDG